MRRMVEGMKNSNITVIALGGSLIVPHLSDTGGIDITFLKAFRRLLLKEIKKGRKFVVITGGGKTCRIYQMASKKVSEITSDDLDRIGVVSTKLNAMLVSAIFGNQGYSEIIHDALSKEKLEDAKKSSKNIFVACGGIPGRSTDYGAIKLAEVFGSKDVIIAGDTPFVYEKDPRKFPEAKAIPELSWVEYEKLIPKKWTPGLSSPVDPIATQLAKKLKLEVKLIRGTDMKNFQAAIEGKKFKGTIIR